MSTQTVPNGNRVLRDWAALARELGRASRRGPPRTTRPIPSWPTTIVTSASIGSSRPACPPSWEAAAPRARYHHLRESAQVTYTGRLALGVDVNGLDSARDAGKEQTT
jgi:hypothetical protein